MTAEPPRPLGDGVVVLRPTAEQPADDAGVVFAIEVEGRAVGTVELHDGGASTGRLTWAVDAGERGRGYGTRAVRLLVRYAFDELRLGRVEARVPSGHDPAIRLARRVGMRNEGRSRAPRSSGERDVVLLGRLADDPPPGDRAGFRALLNSFLPRKRVIAQAVVRDPAGRVLLCHPTYKDDWDLPGGVVEELESPASAVGREITEELGLVLPVGPLLLTDWLPPWSGWDDALSLVFDAGVHEPTVLADVVLQAREIRAVQFLTVEQIRERSADYTARRVEAALAALRPDGPRFSESGRPT